MLPCPCFKFDKSETSSQLSKSLFSLCFARKKCELEAETIAITDLLPSKARAKKGMEMGRKRKTENAKKRIQYKTSV